MVASVLGAKQEKDMGWLVGYQYARPQIIVLWLLKLEDLIIRLLAIITTSLRRRWSGIVILTVIGRRLLVLGILIIATLIAWLWGLLVLHWLLLLACSVVGLGLSVFLSHCEGLEALNEWWQIGAQWQ